MKNLFSGLDQHQDCVRLFSIVSLSTLVVGMSMRGKAYLIGHLVINKVSKQARNARI